MSDAKNVHVRISVDGERVHEGDTHTMLLIDDNGSYSMNVDGLVGVVAMIYEVSDHFSRAIIDIEKGEPFEMTKAKFLELLKARLMLAAMCSSMASFGEIHGLKEFRDTAEMLHDKAIEILDKMDDAED